MLLKRKANELQAINVSLHNFIHSFSVENRSISLTHIFSARTKATEVKAPTDSGIGKC